MKTFKKIVLLLVLMLSIITATAFTVCAEEAVEDGEAVTETAPPSDVETEAEDSETVFTRVYEFCMENIERILGILSLGTGGVLFVFLRKYGKTLISGIFKMLSGQTSATDAAKNAEIATAAMVEKQDRIEERLSETEAASKERDKIMKALLYEVMTFVQMQHTLTLNNASIPQAIKNYTTSLCSNCLAAIENEEELKKAYEEMRSILGIEKKEGAKDEKEND
jgi:hypothetical protein